MHNLCTLCVLYSCLTLAMAHVTHFLGLWSHGIFKLQRQLGDGPAEAHYLQEVSVWVDTLINTDVYILGVNQGWLNGKQCYTSPQFLNPFPVQASHRDQTEQHVKTTKE